MRPGDIPADIEAALLAKKAACCGAERQCAPRVWGAVLTAGSGVSGGPATPRVTKANSRRKPSRRWRRSIASTATIRADAPLSEAATRKSATAFFDKLKRLDANWGRSPKTKSRTLDQLLALSAATDDLVPLSDRTLFRYMIALDQVWDWAKVRGDVREGDSPFSRVK